eukprot:2261908-Ditylum_brightwellii.AAC.1
MAWPWIGMGVHYKCTRNEFYATCIFVEHNVDGLSVVDGLPYIHWFVLSSNEDSLVVLGGCIAPLQIPTYMATYIQK